MNIYLHHLTYLFSRLTASLTQAADTLHRERMVAAVAAFVIGVQCALAYSFEVKGVVFDSQSREPIPYAAVALTTTPGGTLTDDHGRFSLFSYSMADSLRINVMGYPTTTLAINRKSKMAMLVALEPVGVQLSEVVVKPKKEKYRKKGNPAVEFMERIRAARRLTDPHRNDYYNFRKYERMSIAVNNFTQDTTSGFARQFAFLQEHIDTSIVSGKPILNIAMREKVANVNYRHSDDREREHITGLRFEGVIDILSDQENVRKTLEDVFREIDIYKDDITLLQNRFVSPLSPIAGDFYKFYLSDTVVVDRDSCVVLSFVPHTPQTWGFLGKFYIPKNDSTMLIKKVELYLPHSINANFIDGMTVTQTFARAGDGSRLKLNDDMTMELSVLPSMPSLYVRRTTTYGGFNYNAPADEAATFNHSEYQVIDNEAYKQDNTFWNANRDVPLDNAERKMSTMMEQLRQVPLYYWTERTIRLLVSGYVHTGHPSKFDYGPLNTSISYNTVEGVRLRVGGMTTAALSPHWFSRGYVAYGLRDRKWKYSGELEYSFIKKKLHSREFPVHSLRFTSLYDVDQLGQRYLNTNADNFFLSLKRMEDIRQTYRRRQQLDYTLELRNNFSVVATAAFERQEATKWIPFTNGYSESFGHYNEASFELKLRYAPGEKFYQGKSIRLPINLDAPVFELTHTYAPRGFLGSMFPINRTELRYSQRWWLSAFGYIDAVVKGGHVWSHSPYMNLMLPNANLSYTIQPESFALMNPLEFINDSYAMADFTYWMNGLIFNRIPYFNRMRLREMINVKALWGHLSRRNNPADNPQLFTFPTDTHTTPMTNRPYIEASAGLDNILRVLCVEYVWRLTYRNNPEAPRWGVRIAFHLAF
jgi:hypothetical protein